MLQALIHTACAQITIGKLHLVHLEHLHQIADRNETARSFVALAGSREGDMNVALHELYDGNVRA